MAKKNLRILNIREEAYKHFKDLYTKEWDQVGPSMEVILENVPKLVIEEENQMLNKKISKGEIFAAIRGLEIDKAPDPYGFTMHFYRACWPIIKRDIY